MSSFKKDGIYFSILILFLALILLLDNRSLLATFVLAGLYVMVAQGLLLLIGYAGQVSLGHSAFVAIGAYSTGILSTKYGFPVLLSVVLASIIAGLIGWLLGKPTTKLRGYYLAMATLAFGVIVHQLLFELPELTGGAMGLTDIPNLKIGSFVFASDIHYFIMIWLIVMLIQVGVIRLTTSSLGRQLRAIHSDELAAASMGLEVSRLKVITFVLSAALAGIAGGIYALYSSFISPEAFSLDLSIIFAIMVFVGGKNHPWGGVLGGITLTIIPELIRSYRDYSAGIYGVILILLLLYLPNGIPQILDYFKGKKSRNTVLDREA